LLRSVRKGASGQRQFALNVNLNSLGCHISADQHSNAGKEPD